MKGGMVMKKRKKGKGDLIQSQLQWYNICSGLHREEAETGDGQLVDKGEYVKTRALDKVDEQMPLVVKK